MGWRVPADTAAEPVVAYDSGAVAEQARVAAAKEATVRAAFV
jgi:hypothetical protein